MDTLLEVVTPEWRYNSTADTSNYGYVVQVKEQRRLGTVRGNTKTIPQAPSIRVRIRADAPGLPVRASVKADLWTYGVAFKGRNRHEFIQPQEVGKGMKLTKLRNDTYIACVDNIGELSPPAEDGYRYAELNCFITRGARVCSRRNHIAFRLSVVEEKEGYERKKFEDTINLKNSNGKWLSKTQISKLIKPDFGEDCIARTVDAIPPIRTARMSISEKAMCPRECDQKKKKKTYRKRKLIPMLHDMRSPAKKLQPLPSKENETGPREQTTLDTLKALATGSAVPEGSVPSPISKLPFLVSASTQSLLQSLGPMNMYNSIYQAQLLQQLQQQQQQQQQYPIKFPNQLAMGSSPLVQDFASRINLSMPSLMR